MAKLLRTRRTWLIALALVAATAGLIISLFVFADSDQPAFTATLYSDVIRFEADGVASLRVTIYDLSENDLWNSGLIMGDFVDWDRANARGERLANGYYLYLAQGWDGSDTLILNKTGKVVLLPGDQVQLKAAPVAAWPVVDDRDDPIMSPMTQIIDDSLTVRETSGNTYLNVDTPGSGLQSVLYWKENGVGRASMFFNPVADVLNFKTYGADAIAFLTSGVERMRITYAGRVQVGSTSGNAYFDVSAPAGAQPVLYWKEGGVGRASMFYDPVGSELNFKTYGSDAITFVTSGYDRMSVRGNGNVGIGTTNATDLVTIQGSSGNLIACYPGSSRAATVFRVEADGDVYAEGTVYADTFVPDAGADVAERINVSEWVEAGDVVEIDPDHVGFFRKATGLYSRRVAGIISTSPGVILGNDTDPNTDKWEDNRPLLAIAGRVPVKASTENGPIAVGDLLVSSSAHGVAMKGDPAVSIGAVVGKAMEPLGSGEGVIMAQVTLR